jgi:Flp pilus assembly protein TadD
MYRKVFSLFLTLCVINTVCAENKKTNPKAHNGTVLSKAEKEAQRLNEFGLAQVRAKNFLAAEQTFNSALALDSKNLGVVFNLASTYLINKEEDKAISLLKEYIKIAPADAGLYVRLGDAYFGTKNVETAVTSYEQAYKIDPDFPELSNKLGTTYLLSNKIPEAEKHLEAALTKSPKDLRILTNLSSVYLANGKSEKAISTAKKALQVKAGKELYVTLATAYEMNKDYKNALIAYQRAFDLGDSREEIQKKIAGLKKVA